MTDEPSSHRTDEVATNQRGASPDHADLSTERDLEAELDLSRQRLQRVVEEYENSREEMRAASEKLRSMNEQLATVNQENRHRVEELAQLSFDLNNLLASTQIATLFLDRELRIVRFTPQVSELFNVRTTDRGRPLTDLTHRLGYGDLQADARRVLDRLVPVEREIRSEPGRWYLTRILPYRGAEDRIEGVVVTFIDITERKQAEEKVAEAREYAEKIVETLHEPLLVLHPDLTVKSVNQAFYDCFKVRPADTIGRKIYDVGNGQWHIPELRTLLEDVLPANKVFNDFEVAHEFDDIGHRVMLVNGRRLDHVQLILLGIRDITESKVGERALRESEQRYRELVSQVADYAIFRTDPQGRPVTWNEGVQRVLGFREDEFIGADIDPVIFTPEALAAGVLQQDLAEAARTGTAGNDRWMRRKSGERFYAQGVTSAIRDERGEVVGFTKVMRDHTDLKLAEEALRESEERYRLLFNSMDEAYAVVEVLADEAGRWNDFLFLDANAAFVKHTGMEPPVGRTATQLLGTPNPRWAEIYGRVAETGMAVRAVEREETLGRDFDLFIFRLGGPGSRRVAVLFTNITERRRAEEALRQSEARLNAIIEQLPVAVGLAGADGDFLLANQLMRQSVPRVMPSRDPERRQRWRATDAEGAPIPPERWPGALALRGQASNPGIEFQYTDDAGQAQWHLVSAVPFRDKENNVLGAVVVVQEITARKEAEAALQAAKEDAEKASEAKDRFLAVLSHELRTPLSPVLLALPPLEREAGLGEEARQTLAMIRRNIEIEARLIDDLLDQSRVLSGKLSTVCRPVGVHDIIRHAAENTAEPAVSKRIRVSLDLAAPADTVSGDAARLQQVFWNLLSNAVKFTPEGGEVTVSSEGAEGRIRVSVTDTGIGFGADAMERIFRPFEQADAAITKQFGGLGLGLAVCKGIVEAHGGALTAYSDGPGRGARFTIEIPLAAPLEGAGAEPAEPAPPDQPAGARRLLVVEDHDDTARTLDRLLKSEGFEAVVVRSAEAALERLDAEPFDLIISDLGLPDATGFDLMREVRQRGQRIPGIALSGFGQPDDVRKCRQAGFAEHLVKPIDFDRLLVTIRRLGAARAKAQA